MKAKKILYSILLVLFSIILLTGAALFFLEPVTSSRQAGTALWGGFQQNGTLPDGMGERPFWTEEDGNSRTPQSFTLPDGMGERPSRTEGDGNSRTPQSGAPSGENRQQSFGRPEQGETLTGWTFAGYPVPDSLLPASLYPYLNAVLPSRLWIVIGSGLCVLLCILRLIFLVRKSRKEKEMSASADDLPPIRRQAVWPAVMLLIASLILVAILFPADSSTSASSAVAQMKILSGTAGKGTITPALIAAGYLEEQEPVEVNLPASVKLSAVAVKEGEQVEEGQIIAKVNLTSVMVAISDVQKELDAIDTKLKSAEATAKTSTLKAPAAGIVKKVYAKAGDNVSDIMAEYGSLLVLSLDGRMSVDVPASEELRAGTVLIITFEDGTTVSGEVTDLAEETATVSVYDKDYPIGTTVSVSDEAGTLYGSGELYIHRPFRVTGFLGTVSRIYRNEGASVSQGTTLIQLSDVVDSAEFVTLLEQRQEYEEELNRLFELYQSGFIVSPSDGVVGSIQEDVPYQEVSLLFGEDSTIRFAGTSPEDSNPSDYVHIVGQVVTNVGGTLDLNISIDPVTITDYTQAASLAGTDMPESGIYSIPSSTTVYTYSGTWTTMPAADIAPGDLVLFTFDGNGSLVWVICCPGAAPTPTPTPTPTPSPTPTPGPTRDPNATDDPNRTPRPSSNAFPSSIPGGNGSGRRSSINFSIPGSGSGTQEKPAYTIAEQTLLTVTPQETMTLSVSIDEMDILTLSVGESVRLYFDALPGTSFPGTITKIDPEGVNSGGNTKYTVTVATDRTGNMLPGMNAAILISREPHENVLLIPVAALNEEGNQITVYTGYDSENDLLFNPVPVKTGISDGENVEILSGLEEGSPYYYRYAESISYTVGE